MSWLGDQGGEPPDPPQPSTVRQIADAIIDDIAALPYTVDTRDGAVVSLRDELIQMARQIREKRR